MTSDLTKLEFALDDESGGLPLTPETVDLPTLRGFLEEVEKLIKGDAIGTSLADSRVRIEEGSVKVVALVASLLAADVSADLEKLDRTGDLDSIQKRRADVIEQWQSRTLRSPRRRYSILSLPMGRPLSVNNNTHFQHSGENSWVSVEKYLTGEIKNAGGKQSPNLHLDLSETGESIVVNASPQQIAEEPYLVYKHRTIRVQAEQNLRTKELRNVRLLQFLPQTSEVDEQALAKLWLKGNEAWQDVPSATEWVEEMRGNR